MRRLAALVPVAAGVELTGRLGMILGAGLVAMALALIIVLSMTATFADKDRQKSARRVLRILLGQGRADDS